VSPLVAEPQAIAVSVIPHADVDDALRALLFRQYGINDLAGIEGAQERVVRLSPSSTVVCPAHGHLLMPDACRSCRFLAGEVQPQP
jgi:hypothetical protein